MVYLEVFTTKVLQQTLNISVYKFPYGYENFKTDTSSKLKC